MNYNDRDVFDVQIPQQPSGESYAIPSYAYYQAPEEASESYTTNVQEESYITTQPIYPVPFMSNPPPVAPPPPPMLLPPQPLPSIFPPVEPPFGPVVTIFLEDNSRHQKRNRRIAGAGVAALSVVATGGLVILPLAAGLAVNKVVKYAKEKCIYAYANTYVYEIRSALARGLGVLPELLQLKRKGVMLEDCFHIAQYFAHPGKNRIHLTMHVKEHPVAGSVCTYPGQYVYPPPQFVDCSSYKFASSAVCYSRLLSLGANHTHCSMNDCGVLH